MNKQSSFFIYLVIVLFAVGAGYAIGHFTSSPTVDVLPQATATQTVKVRDASDATALSKALSEVEALKAENERLKAAAQNTPPEPENGEEMNQQPPRRQSWQERMAELRETDPERYEKEVARREQFEKMMKQRRTEQVNFLDSIDVSLMPVEAQGIHARFTAAIARQGQLQEEMMALMEAGEQPSDELREEMRATSYELRVTREEERAALLDAIGTSMGLEAEEVADFTALVSDVFNATSMQMRPMMPPQNGGGQPPEMPR